MEEITIIVEPIVTEVTVVVQEGVGVYSNMTNIDGGAPESVYLISEIIDGGTP